MMPVAIPHDFDETLNAFLNHSEQTAHLPAGVSVDSWSGSNG